MSDCTVTPKKGYLAYCRSLNANSPAERCIGWYFYNGAAVKISSVPPRFTSHQKLDSHGSFITRSVGEVPVRFRKARMMSMSTGHSAAETFVALL